MIIKTRLLLIISLVLLSPRLVTTPLSAQGGINVDMAITGAQLRAALSNPGGGPISPNPTHLRYLGGGKLLLVDSTVEEQEEVFLVDISDARPQFRRMVGDVELRKKAAAVSRGPVPVTTAAEHTDHPPRGEGPAGRPGVLQPIGGVGVIHQHGG